MPTGTVLKPLPAQFSVVPLQVQLVVSSTCKSTASVRKKKIRYSYASHPGLHLTCIQSCQHRILTLERRDKLPRQRLLFDSIEKNETEYPSHSSGRYMCSKHSSCRYNQPIVDK